MHYKLLFPWKAGLHYIFYVIVVLYIIFLASYFYFGEVFQKVLDFHHAIFYHLPKRDEFTSLFEMFMSHFWFCVKCINYRTNFSCQQRDGIYLLCLTQEDMTIFLSLIIQKDKYAEIFLLWSFLIFIFTFLQHFSWSWSHVYVCVSVILWYKLCPTKKYH